MMKRALSCTLAALLVVASGCGDDDDPAGPTGDTLSEADFALMLEALQEVNLFSSGFTAIARGATAPDRIAADFIAAATLSVTVDNSGPCPDGGTVRVQGSASRTTNDNEESGSAAANLTVTLSGCRGTASNGRVFTFDGNPDMNYTLSGTFSPTAFSFTASQEGGIRWSSNGDSGTCPVDVTVTITGSETSFSGSATGRVCARTVNQTFTHTN